ncbi:hypothetical protein [Faecalibaculum rodentium]|uniref:hypothetical protein n=1 Tax=Faecalibaculum rodentium TaxID=1702221 RepID=UPI0027312803|nr:hypothetical protein [Faecalibaculum rodentium]
MPKLNEQKLIEFAKKLEELGIDPVLMMENAYEDETSKAFPYPGCPYFEVTQYGNVVPKKHWGEGTEEEKMYMERMAELCNCWRTQKEAELEVERREIRQILINYGGSPVFDKDNENWVIVLSHSGEYVYSLREMNPKFGSIYFRSEEDADEVLGGFGERLARFMRDEQGLSKY